MRTPYHLAHRKRLTFKAGTPLKCETCKRTIRKGHYCVAIVRWIEQLVNVQTGERRDNDLDKFKVDVTVVADPNPKAVVKISGKEGTWRLKEAPKILVYHPDNCGVETNRPAYIMSGSYGGGRRR